MTAGGAGDRWQTYVRHRDEALSGHWRARFDDGASVSLIMGIGFDPRMCLGLECLAAVAPDGRLSITAIEFGGPTDPIGEASAVATRAKFESLVQSVPVETRTITASEGTGNFSRDAAAIFSDLEDVGSATDIVVDVNALPRSIFFPLISKLLFLCDEAGEEAPNLHLFAGDAAWLDQLIVAEGLDEQAEWLYPFAGSFLSEATQHLPRIWIPVLGEGHQLALQRISEHVDPRETCPLLPFPSRHPRRGDLLFEEYQGVLFDQLRSDSGAVLYADEGNPFQVYRRLRQSTIHYSRSLAELGGCKVAFSSLSSKLMSLGVLLAAYEFKDSSEHETGVAEIGAQVLRLEREVSLEEAREKSELVGITISGDCYH
jgi:hypothetical protein